MYIIIILFSLFCFRLFINFVHCSKKRTFHYFFFVFLLEDFWRYRVSVFIFELLFLPEIRCKVYVLKNKELIIIIYTYYYYLMFDIIYQISIQKNIGFQKYWHLNWRVWVRNVIEKRVIHKVNANIVDKTYVFLCPTKHRSSVKTSHKGAHTDKHSNSTLKYALVIGIIDWGWFHRSRFF